MTTFSNGRVTSTLTKDGLHALLTAEIGWLRIAQYLDPQDLPAIADKAARRLNHSASRSSIYITDGLPLFDSLSDDRTLFEYFSMADNYSKSIKELFRPHKPPSERLLQTLKELWPFAVDVLRHHGKSAYFGILRLWPVGGYALPHQDLISRELPGLDSRTAQLGVNFYLDVPVTGGEVVVSKQQITDAEWRKLGVNGSYGFAEESLAEHDVVQPSAGDLILINTSFVHAVSRVQQGRRITLSGFVARSPDTNNLSCWS